jgi:transcriptional regulator with XRE-family HTH domain
LRASLILKRIKVKPLYSGIVIEYVCKWHSLCFVPGGLEYMLPDPHSDFIFRSDEVMGWMRWLREIHNLSQRDLEAIADVSQSEIHKIETGQQECRLSSFAAICAELGVPPGWVLDLMVQSNVSLFNQSVLNDPDLESLLGQLNATAAHFRRPFGLQLATSCTMAAILIRCSIPVRRSMVPAYPTDDLRERFLRFAHRLQSQLAPAEKFKIILSLRDHPCAELDRLGLLSHLSLQMQRDSLSMPPAARRRQDFGWTPWVLTIEDAKRMWNFDPVGLEKSENNMLTNTESDAKLPPVKSQLENLLADLNHLTKESGKKTELADFLGAPLASVSRWLSGEREPGGETTLKMLRWVEQQER